MNTPRLLTIASAGLLVFALTTGGVAIAGPAGAATTSHSAAAKHPKPKPEHKTKRGGTAARGAPLKCIQVRCRTATDRARGKVVIEHEGLRSKPPRPHFGKARVRAVGHGAGRTARTSSHAVEHLRTHQ